MTQVMTKQENLSAHYDFASLRSGRWMNGFTPEIAHALARCEELCFQLNHTSPSRCELRDGIVRKIFRQIGQTYVLHSPFFCDFGFNIKIGENFVGNFNLTMLDEAEITIGDNVFIGPNTTLCTIIHELEPEKRNDGIMQAKPIVIGDNVWIATGVIVLPGVTIGEGAVIGAGSVVTKDVPSHTVAAGNPCKVMRSLNKL